MSNVDLDDPNIKSQLMMLVPFIMAHDLDGLIKTFVRIDPALQLQLFSTAKRAHDLLGEIIDRLKDLTPYPEPIEFPDLIGESET